MIIYTLYSCCGQSDLFMQTCKGEQQAFSSEYPLYTNKRNQMINDLNVLGFESILKKKCMAMKDILKRLAKLPSVLCKSSLRQQVDLIKPENLSSHLLYKSKPVKLEWRCSFQLLLVLYYTVSITKLFI